MQISFGIVATCCQGIFVETGYDTDYLWLAGHVDGAFSGSHLSSLVYLLIFILFFSYLPCLWFSSFRKMVRILNNSDTLGLWLDMSTPNLLSNTKTLTQRHEKWWIFFSVLLPFATITRSLLLENLGELSLTSVSTIFIGAEARLLDSNTGLSAAMTVRV